MTNKLGAIPLSPDILSKSHIGLWAFELDEGKPPRMYVDETMLELLGLTEQKLPEETYHAWYDNIDEGSYGLVADTVEKMTAGEHAEVQYPWNHPNGHVVIVRCGGVRNPEYKNGIRIEGTHQDVTKVLHLDEEEMLRIKKQELDLVKSKFRAECLSFVTDNDADVNEFLNFFGKQICEMFGCDQVIFRGLEGNRLVINADGVEDISQEICEECQFSKIDNDIYGKDGVIIMNDCRQGYNGVLTHCLCHVKSSMMQQIYTNGKLSGVLSIHYLNEYHTFTDDGIEILLTVGRYLGLLMGRIQAKKIEREKLKAESANKAKTEFFFNMSHDIRTPMNAIMGFTNIAEKNIENKEKVANCLEKISQSGNLLLSLIDSILDMSRIEFGNTIIEKNPADIFKSFDSIETTMKGSADSKNIKLSFDFEDISDRYVFCDINRCLRVFVNLITNAVKYTEKGGYVRVKCKQVGSKDGFGLYQYTVEDNGIGMSDEFIEHIFEQFAREQNDNVITTQGTGLGLSVCKSFVELMNGKIECHSVQGKGTTFVVTLPFKIREELETEEQENNANDSGLVNEISCEGKRILLVEDNELNREIAIDIFEELGFITDSANDGEHAVNLLKENGADYYDYIFMDIQMPKMNGYEATKKIREMYNEKDIPIIALSANAFSEDKEASLAAGMNDHIAKPINMNELIKILHKFR